MTTHDGGIGPDGRPAPYMGQAKFVFAFDMRARSQHVGEHTRRPAEYVTVQRDTFIQCHIVLYLTAVPDTHAARP